MDEFANPRKEKKLVSKAYALILIQLGWTGSLAKGILVSIAYLQTKGQTLPNEGRF
jgi:hypothetical protein